ncbi:condensin-2 complex subunit H2-like [Phoenix dactylifera]|uniref:Condensin-2 complex subunit H2-like n=1 Tax=Phoenix dactylifera TaxID=42345 RepID=A0A8B8ZKQ7_PHODC|nr:condensin-2 complex subunit H2-like [Phoenix dactylifera]XP_038977885.1 condensin-2 complex subunit H2-like [Phoenix dactylifera]
MFKVSGMVPKSIGPDVSSTSLGSLKSCFILHLDALLASIAETEKQTELATRVSTWKERIEHTSEEQDTHPPFDIHLYGERILDKLSFKVDSGGSMSSMDVVMGQPKHDVARTFSALLQLVNNGNVDLQRAPASDEFVHLREVPSPCQKRRYGQLFDKEES